MGQVCDAIELAHLSHSAVQILIRVWQQPGRHVESILREIDGNMPARYLVAVQDLIRGGLITKDENCLLEITLDGEAMMRGLADGLDLQIKGDDLAGKEAA